MKLAKVCFYLLMKIWDSVYKLRKSCEQDLRVPEFCSPFCVYKGLISVWYNISCYPTFGSQIKIFFAFVAFSGLYSFFVHMLRKLQSTALVLDLRLMRPRWLLSSSLWGRQLLLLLLWLQLLLLLLRFGVGERLSSFDKESSIPLLSIVFG